MKEQRLLNALGTVDERYIEEASPVRVSKRAVWLKWGAVAACVCLVGCAFAISYLFKNPVPRTEVAEVGSLEEIASAYDGKLLAEKLTASGAKTTAVRLSYARGGDVSDPTAWNTLSIEGDYNGQDFALDCDFDGEGEKKDPAEAYTVTQYGDVEATIYREECDWEDRYLYRAEFTLDGVAYSLSTHSDDLKDIYAYLDIVLGEPENNGEPSGAALTDVLGLGVCRIEMEEISPYFYRWHYYVEMDGEDVCVAEQFGYGGDPESWSRDLDGDGVPELICNVTYGDGVEVVKVYRNHNGVIEEGSTRWDYYCEKFGWSNIGEFGVPGLPIERYDPERDVFVVEDVMYYSSDDPPETAEFNDGLAPFDFYPFEHLP